MDEPNYRCPLCDCTVRTVSDGGNGVYTTHNSMGVLAHEACIRLRDRAEDKRRAGRRQWKRP